MSEGNPSFHTPIQATSDNIENVKVLDGSSSKASASRKGKTVTMTTCSQQQKSLAPYYKKDARE